MAWPKGKKRGYKSGGRVAGRNVTADIRQMARAALDQVGGQEYLALQARANPKAFLALVARLVPAESKNDVTVSQPVQINVVTGFESGPHIR